MKTDGEKPSRPIRLKVGAMEPEHVDRVVEIERRVFSDPWKPPDFLKIIENPASIALSAVHKDLLVGYSCCWTMIESAELGNIAVHPDFQGRSVALRLLDETVRLCRGRDVERIFLEVRASNERAIGIYLRYGFERIGVRRNYYSRPPEDAIIMKLELVDRASGRRQGGT